MINILLDGARLPLQNPRLKHPRNGHFADAEMSENTLTLIKFKTSKSTCIALMSVPFRSVKYSPPKLY